MSMASHQTINLMFKKKKKKKSIYAFRSQYYNMEI